MKFLHLDFFLKIRPLSYLFCNIPILICYFKREWLLGVIFSIIVIVYNYYVYDISNLLSILKFIIYLVGYFILCKKREFNYLFFKVMAVVQGFFLAFEYFMNPNTDIKDIHIIMIYMILILCISYLSLYLFKLADNITSLYVNMNKVNEENKLKNSLFKLTHEIKNPIAVCKGYLDMINIDNKEKTVKYIGIIKSEIDRSLNVMNDFMDDLPEPDFSTSDNTPTFDDISNQEDSEFPVDNTSNDAFNPDVNDYEAFNFDDFDKFGGEE